ncbi:serine protease snake-like [Ceratina calcarata]|uniref:Serine protease snake-like n=1 Tax=Ceratina calcarata TaxID=156304 RepID=A0AAJ7N3R0_9HYME|nr:serine protease snake-like [Ceratina calcarata]
MCSNLLSTVLVKLSLIIIAFAFNEDLYEGSPCTLENGAPGVCKRLPDCPPRLAEVEEGKRSSSPVGRCGFDDFIEIVCCPANVSQKIFRRPAEVACEQYDTTIGSRNGESGAEDLTLHIFGGVEARSGEFPYMVALGYQNDVGIKYSCGGSLISSQHVLTAAHCVNNVNEIVPIEVRLGDESLNSTAESVQRISISDIISHPKYKRSAQYNDIAILKLKTKVQLSNTVKPICLQTRSLNHMTVTSRTALVVIGWGATSFDVENSVKLMRTHTLSVMSREDCAKYYSGFLKLPRGIDENLICAVDRNETRRSDACQGDSGGPLLMLTEKGDRVIGITAFGQSCGTKVPGVYTAVYSYLDWIEEHVWIGDKAKESRKLEPPTQGVVKTGFINITITYE